LLLSRHLQAREFENELRAQTKVSKSAGAWLEGSGGSSLGSGSDTSNVSDAYARMLRIFIPLLVDEVVAFEIFQFDQFGFQMLAMSST
jgi:hypothetical protein